MKAETLRVQTPCEVDWNAMEGCGARRFCGSCRKSVTDLSALTERQARAVVAQPDVCVRYTVTARGDVRFRRSVGARLLALGAALAPSAAFAGGQPAEGGLFTRIAEAVGLIEAQREQVLMGDIAMVQPSAVSFTNTTGANVSVTCDGVAQPVQAGATAEITVFEGAGCVVQAGERSEALTWADRTRSCTLTADTFSCTNP